MYEQRDFVYFLRLLRERTVTGTGTVELQPEHVVEVHVFWLQNRAP